MVVDEVIGGQGGDEGKGKICAYLAKNGFYDICMRVPSPQAGHSIYHNGQRLGLALIPCGFVNPQARLLIGAGGLISLEKLLREIEATGVTPERLGVDAKATVVTEQHKERERANEYLMKKIGSVGTGVSQCRVEKLMRGAIAPVIFAETLPEIQAYLTNTKAEINLALDYGEKILLEGDHGAKLDLIHGEFPMVTTRAVNAAGFLSEAGIGPRDVRNIYVCLKPYTTRVADGPMEGEIFDEAVLNWGHEVGGETGTVSKRLRRMGKFEWKNVQDVIKMNSANKLVFTHMDAPEFVWNALGYKNAKTFLEDVEKKLCRSRPNPQISLLSFGPEEKDVVPYVDYLNAQQT